MLTIENDWEKLTYKWNGETVKDILTVRYNHDGRNHEMMARMHGVTKRYMDGGHSHWVDTHVLEVYIPMLAQWVEVKNTKYIIAIYDGKWLT